MASEHDDTVFPEEDLDDDDDDDSQSQDDDDLDNDDVLIEEEEDEEDDLNFPSPSTSFRTGTANATVAASASSIPTATINSSTPAVTVAVPISSVMPSTAVDINDFPTAIVNQSEPDPKRQRVGETLVVQNDIKKPQPLPQMDDSRRLFQRLWTDEDEIELLQGFLEYTAQRGGNAHHQDTTLFYDQIKSKLQLDFNKNQLVEKLRRLKKKYRNVVNKISSGKEFSFKSPHDQATFEISRKIWSKDNTVLDDDEGNPNANPVDVEVKTEDFGDRKATPKSRKRSRPKSSGGAKVDDRRAVNDEFVLNNYNSNNTNNNNANNNGNVSSLIEETVKSCLSPLFKELLGGAMGLGGPSVGAGRGLGALAMNAMPLSFGGQVSFGGEVMDERWRKQQIMELEVYSKRLELVQDQIKAALEELRSAGG
ncbi:mediator-associated protein 1 [Tripterygium wilfordii]|uniref:Mediator-associated protein 1 n=1 Tax=Tripterygium wilfordii TaxID=458696 RepID=A0A7J7D2I6_TRIWF|nr:probable transcription factor At3g04930 [Tripterygium wilfordii]KAF5740541.1 mediator-associated protein 1 [Tripterygium wilfordii]